jgi:hypothetical protein
MPPPAALAIAVLAQSVREQRREGGFPLPYGFVGKDKAPLYKHLD